jgi:hypothetical protein
MLDQALNDGLIERHPLNKLVLSKLLNKKTIKSDWEVDPFDQDEIKPFSMKQMDKRAIYFNLLFLPDCVLQN